MLINMITTEIIIKRVVRLKKLKIVSGLIVEIKFSKKTLSSTVGEVVSVTVGCTISCWLICGFGSDLKFIVGP